MKIDKCPICHISLPSAASMSPDFIWDIKCEACGSYSLPVGADLDTCAPLDKEQRRLLSGVIRNASSKGKRLSITSANIESLIASASPPEGPLEAMDRILVYVSEQSDGAGSWVPVSRYDYSLIYAESAELDFILDHLMAEGLLQPFGGNSTYRLTVDGWRRIRELRTSHPTSRQAFVAMWFSPEMQDIWHDGFKLALEETGYSPVRIDLVQHNDKIDDVIISEIRKSGLLVADFTGHRGGVYFEAGFALGLGMPVIWTCQSGCEDDLHFDTRQYNHIVWRDTSELKEKLISRIEATLPLL